VPTPAGQPPITVINNNNNTNNVNVVVQQAVAQQQNIQPVLIQQPVAPTPLPPVVGGVNNFQVMDEATQTAFRTPGSPYTGTAAGIQNQYVNINTTNLDITAITPNTFIRSGSGNDTLKANAGRNVLHAGGGSNIMVGGVGTDTFLAGVGSGATVVDLIKDFHAGDDVVIRGLNATDFTLSFTDGTGAFGQQLQITAVAHTGGTKSTIALAGFSTGDIANGRLSVSFSQEAGSNTPFMLIHANS